MAVETLTDLWLHIYSHLLPLPALPRPCDHIAAKQITEGFKRDTQIGIDEVMKGHKQQSTNKGVVVFWRPLMVKES